MPILCISRRHPAHIANESPILHKFCFVLLSKNYLWSQGECAQSHCVQIVLFFLIQYYFILTQIKLIFWDFWFLGIPVGGAESSYVMLGARGLGALSRGEAKTSSLTSKLAKDCQMSLLNFSMGITHPPVRVIENFEMLVLILT